MGSHLELCVCVCVCACACERVRSCVCACVCVCVCVGCMCCGCMCEYAWMCACLCVCTCMCVCAHARACMHVRVCVHECVCLRVCVRVCMYVRTCVRVCGTCVLCPRGPTLPWTPDLPNHVRYIPVGLYRQRSPDLGPLLRHHGNLVLLQESRDKTLLAVWQDCSDGDRQGTHWGMRSHVTTVACKGSQSFCQKCWWQVTATHTCTPHTCGFCMT